MGLGPRRVVRVSYYTKTYMKTAEQWVENNLALLTHGSFDAKVAVVRQIQEDAMHTGMQIVSDQVQGLVRNLQGKRLFCKHQYRNSSCIICGEIEPEHPSVYPGATGQPV